MTQSTAAPPAPRAPSGRDAPAPGQSNGPLPIQLRLLGGFALADGLGQDLPLPYDKARLLLAVLALEPGAMSRERLAELLWPRSAPAQARANLRRAVFDLKQCLAGPDPAVAQALEADKKQLRLRASPLWQVDARQFAEPLPGEPDAAVLTPASATRLRDRLALYRGGLLEGLPLGDAEIDAWLHPLREALASLAGQRLLRLAAWHGACGQPAEALACARRALALDPWNEPALQQAMRLATATDRAAALALFEQYRERLHATLGLQPGPATLALAGQLRQADGPAAAAPAPERRRVVALACELDAGLDDPEALALLLQPALAGLADWLRTQGAHVQRADSGELLAYFGHPAALERASQRALLAADGLRQRLPAGVQARLGLHAGWAYSDPRHGGPDAAGTLARPARRLAAQAGPDEIWVSAELRALLPDGFLFDGTGAGPGRLRALAPTAPPQARPMVGRADELARLRALAQDLTPGPLAAWVQGEPGLGKTRLLRALADSMAQATPAASALRQLAFQPETRHSPYHPFIAALREQGTADEPAGKRTNESLLCARLTAGASPSAAPLVLLEDLHWADPSSLDLLARCLQPGAATLRLVMSSREPPPAVLRPLLDLLLPLAPLPAPAMRELVRQLPLPDEAAARAVLARAEGVPLFAEELARSLQAAPGEPLPATLWDLLATRLDALAPEARQLAQAAAVIGIEVDPALLQAVQGDAAALPALAAAGLLDPPSPGAPGGATLEPPRPRWRFRHALLRDAAYASLSLERRQQLHRRVADALLGPCAALAARHPEQLARQLDAAGDPLAAHYWLQAGRAAAALGAHTEACEAFTQGLQGLRGWRAPAAPTTSAPRSLPLLLALGNSQLTLQGYGSAAARLSFTQALALAQGPEDGPARFQALWGLWLGSRSGQDDEAPLASAQRLVDEARRQGDPAADAQAAYAMGNNLFFAGQLEPAATWLERASALAARVPATALALRFGEHGGITAQAMLGWLRALQGRPDDALAQGEAALAAAQALRHAQTQAYALALLAVQQRHLRRPAPAARRARELLAFAATHELQLWQAVGGLVLGWALAAQGDPSGLEPIHQAVAASAQAMPSAEATFITFLVDALLALGRGDEARPWITDAMAKALQRHEGYLLPELQRAQALG